MVLAGGTDVAEVALFSLDALPQTISDAETISQLQSVHALVRFPTGSDGGYLLHAYVDEPIPSRIDQYCLKDDEIRSRLSLISGRIGFGGVEATFAEFKPNSNIRPMDLLRRANTA